MANSDDSSSTTCTVRVLVSFYLAATDDSSNARTSPIHKEKFNIPLSGDEHKDLFKFVRHLKTLKFTGLAEIAKSKGLGENPEVTIARIQKDQDYMRQWDSEHGKAVRPLSVRQNNTKHAAGNLPLNMYSKELSVGDRVTEDPVQLMILVTSSQSMIPTPATKKTGPPTKKTRSRLFL